MSGRRIEAQQDVVDKINNLPERMQPPEGLIDAIENLPGLMKGTGSLTMKHTDDQGRSVVRRVSRREGKGRTETIEVLTS